MLRNHQCGHCELGTSAAGAWALTSCNGKNLSHLFGKGHDENQHERKQKRKVLGGVQKVREGKSLAVGANSHPVGLCGHQPRCQGERADHGDLSKSGQCLIWGGPCRVTAVPNKVKTVLSTRPSLTRGTYNKPSHFEGNLWLCNLGISWFPPRPSYRACILTCP